MDVPPRYFNPHKKFIVMLCTRSSLAHSLVRSLPLNRSYFIYLFMTPITLPPSPPFATILFEVRFSHRIHQWWWFEVVHTDKIFGKKIAKSLTTNIAGGKICIDYEEWKLEKRETNRTVVRNVISLNEYYYFVDESKVCPATFVDSTKLTKHNQKIKFFVSRNSYIGKLLQSTKFRTFNLLVKMKRVHCVKLFRRVTNTCGCASLWQPRMWPIWMHMVASTWNGIQ